MVNRGFIAIALIPILIVSSLLIAASFDTFTPIVVAALYAICGGAIGLVWLGAGLVRGRNVRRELRELDEGRLPKARLLQ